MFLIALLAGSYFTLLTFAVLTGFLSFDDIGRMDECAPIHVFLIDGSLVVHFKNIGGFVFELPFAVIFCGGDGDTITRRYGWAHDFFGYHA